MSFPNGGLFTYHGSILFNFKISHLKLLIQKIKERVYYIDDLMSTLSMIFLFFQFLWSWNCPKLLSFVKINPKPYHIQKLRRALLYTKLSILLQAYNLFPKEKIKHYHVEIVVAGFKAKLRFRLNHPLLYYTCRCYQNGLLLLVWWQQS